MAVMETRESRYVTVARIAYHLAQQALPRYAHPKSPHHFTLPQLASCVLLMFYLDCSYRDMEQWLLASEAVCRALDLPRVSGHTTLQRAYHKLRVPDFERMKNQLLAEIDPQPEEAIATDSSELVPGNASQSYRTRSGRAYSPWGRGIYAVGTRSQWAKRAVGGPDSPCASPRQICGPHTQSAR